MANRNRYFTDMDRDKLLAAIGECRRACIETNMRAPIQGDVYKACCRLTVAIDELAGVLTGDREHFHIKTAPGGI